MFVGEVGLAFGVAPVLYAELMKIGHVCLGGCYLAYVVGQWAVEAEVGAALLLGGGLAQQGDGELCLT